MENFLAAYALARDFGISPNACVEAFLSFQKPPHRIQFVRSVNDVSYYDDSKGTNIDAVERAVESLPQDILLIAGGVHKGESYTSWITAFNGRVKKIFVIGEAAPLMEQDLSIAIPVERHATLDDAVHAAAKIAKPGSSVLLSPGCSSYDMFKNYKERGEKFQQLVKEL
jgi:UDP-N-acetylmuramoylalanine--D-glutamate ligase